jgi:hypothetical protein
MSFDACLLTHVRRSARCDRRVGIFDRIRQDSTGFEMNDISSRTATPAADAAVAPELPRKPLSPAAQRALAEAEQRRAAAQASAAAPAKEFQGPSGPEPTRFGDWERKGIASDF